MRQLILFLLALNYLLSAPNFDAVMDYEVDLRLKLSGELEIKEEMEYHLNPYVIFARHGIRRNLPTHRRIHSLYLNPLNTQLRRVFHNDKVAKYTYEPFNDTHYQLRIGGGEKVDGTQHYKLYYDVQQAVSNTKSKKFDTTHWTLLDGRIDIPIRTFKVRMHLPNYLSNSNAFVTIKHYKYACEHNCTDYITQEIRWIDERFFEVKLNTIAPKDRLDLTLNYPKNILAQDGAKNQESMTVELGAKVWSVVVLLLLPLLLYRRWRKMEGALPLKARSSTKYPKLPQELSILQVALIKYRRINTSHLFAALVELAAKGYLEMTKKDASESASFYRLKQDASTLTEEMKHFLTQSLFGGERAFKINNQSFGTTYRLSEGFNRIKSTLYDWLERSGYMHEELIVARKSFVVKLLFIFLPLFGLSIAGSIMLVGWEVTLLSLLALLTGFITLYARLWINSVLGVGVILLIFATTIMVMGGINLMFLIYTPFLAWFITLLLLKKLYYTLGGYRDRATELKEQIDGLEYYLKSLKLKRVRQILKEDPEFLNRHFAYAVLFGVSEKWIGFYKKLQIRPTWYIGEELDYLLIIEEEVYKNSTFYKQRLLKHAMVFGFIAMIALYLCFRWYPDRVQHLFANSQVLTNLYGLDEKKSAFW